MELLFYSHLKAYKDGLFFSHVPNEFNFRRLFKVMFFNKHSVLFHDQDEQNNPHLRRFTNIGYKEFLEQEFILIEYDRIIQELIELVSELNDEKIFKSNVNKKE